MDIYKYIGVAGLLFIIVGVLTKNRKTQNYFYIAGGLSLEIYSIYLGDAVFIVLQLIFTAAAIVDLFRLRGKSS